MVVKFFSDQFLHISVINNPYQRFIYSKSLGILNLTLVKCISLVGSLYNILDGKIRNISFISNTIKE